MVAKIIRFYLLSYNFIRFILLNDTTIDMRNITTFAVVYHKKKQDYSISLIIIIFKNYKNKNTPSRKIKTSIINVEIQLC